MRSIAALVAAVLVGCGHPGDPTDRLCRDLWISTVSPDGQSTTETKITECQNPMTGKWVIWRVG